MSDPIDIVAFLQAMSENEMAQEVDSMALRLEAFANGLDRECMEAQSRAFDEVVKQRDGLLAAIEPLRARFKSGNAIPVERATIRAEEWANVEAALARAEGRR